LTFAAGTYCWKRPFATVSQFEVGMFTLVSPGQAFHGVPALHPASAKGIGLLESPFSAPSPVLCEFGTPVTLLMSALKSPSRWAGPKTGVCCVIATPLLLPW